MSSVQADFTFSNQGAEILFDKPQKTEKLICSHFFTPSHPALCNLYTSLPPVPCFLISPSTTSSPPEPPAPSSLSGGALNSVPDRPAHPGAQRRYGVCAVLSGTLPPRQSTQRTATTEPPEPPGNRLPQSGLCRKGSHRSLPRSSHTYRKEGRGESGEREGRQEYGKGLKAVLKGRLE